MPLGSLFVFFGLVGKVFLEVNVTNGLEVGVLQPPSYGLFPTKCIEDLGCFYSGPPFFNPLYRPISLLPVDGIEPRFLLFTPSTPDEPYLLNATQEDVVHSNFVSGLPTKILIHGYRVKLNEDDVRFRCRVEGSTPDANEDPPCRGTDRCPKFSRLLRMENEIDAQLMKDELLKEAPYNVIIVDWSDWNGFPYTQAVANARVVGAHVAKLIRHLMENKGAIPQSFHLIGHSLGGQVSGWAGERIPDLGRITGLDPAGPFFQNAENEVRLDTSDATFVDVIHSNGGNNVYEVECIPCEGIEGKIRRRVDTQIIRNISMIKTSGSSSPVVKVLDHDSHVMSSSPVPLKTRHVEQHCTLNLARAQTSSRW
ncbi:pancreatic triacylglycerol lipase [Trichonephila clavipes]|nr:pancreatic triacylglycerol lipase [Trichonephila clavipes]